MANTTQTTGMYPPDIMRERYKSNNDNNQYQQFAYTAQAANSIPWQTLLGLWVGNLIFNPNTAQKSKPLQGSGNDSLTGGTDSLTGGAGGNSFGETPLLWQTGDEFNRSLDRLFGMTSPNTNNIGRD